MQRIMNEAREMSNNTENGVITVMLREVALEAAKDPEELDNYELIMLDNNEATMKKRDIKKLSK